MAFRVHQAYNPLTWLSQSKEFYDAASELNQLNISRHDVIKKATNLGNIDSENFNHIGPSPIIYSLAFSLELAIKAAFISQLPDSKKTANTRAEFLSHDLLELAMQIEGFILQPKGKEEKYLRWASNIILDGKYPAGPRPSNTESSLVLPSYENFRHYTYPIFKFMCDTVHSNRPKS